MEQHRPGNGSAPARKSMILLIAYGNSLRRDEGAGFVLADILETLLLETGVGVERIDSRHLTPELVLDVAGENVLAVAFVDTRAVSTPIEEPWVQVERIVPAEISSAGPGPCLDPCELLACASFLFKKAPPAWLISIPGVDFGHGEGLSEITQQAIENGKEDLKSFARAISSW
jgi:Ni,Fe-hydrogenase maturation factor